MITNYNLNCRKNKASGVRLKPLHKEKTKSKKTRKPSTRMNFSRFEHWSDGYRSDFEDETSQEESASDSRKVRDDIALDMGSVEDQVVDMMFLSRI